MNTAEMISIVLDVIDANIDAAPADVADEAIGEWLDNHGWRIFHVHGDDPDLVNVFAGPTWLFQCSRTQYREVMRRVEKVIDG